MDNWRTVIGLIATFGVLHPYLARIPGVFTHGESWFTSYLGTGLLALVYFGVFNAVLWGAILFAIRSYRHTRSALWPALLGFSFPLIAHSQVDLASDPQAAVLLILIPLYGLPLVFVGWLIGRWVDQR